MSFYELFDYNSFKWLDIEEKISEAKLNSLNDVKVLISILSGISVANDVEFTTIDEICRKKLFSELKIVSIFNDIAFYSLKLKTLFPSSKISRLNRRCKQVEFTRSQILCLLSHMVLCTLDKTPKNFYWTTFENWLTDGRCCAIAYLETLLEYFRQSFEIINHGDSNEYMNEIVSFRRNEANLDEIETILKSIDRLNPNETISLKLNGLIGDDSDVEVDFANQDIGFGITGTQEEILFGSSPELCVAMLFCDTLEENEAIAITGARRVSTFNGYGLNVTLNSFVPIDYQMWKNRVVIAIDALDLSYCIDDSFEKQIEAVNLKRELIKAFSGFSCVVNKNISTGHWGCGAFNGNKQLKALLQVIAAVASSNQLIFYCRNDKRFYDKMSEFFCINLKDKNALELWKDLLDLTKNNVFDGLFES